MGFGLFVALTLGVRGPGGGLRARLLLFPPPAGAGVQLLQHGGAELPQALLVQARLLADAVDGQRVGRQALQERGRRVKHVCHIVSDHSDFKRQH